MGAITLKAARVNVGLTQEQAAELIGVTVKTVQNWENGTTSPTMEQAKKIVEIYRRDINGIIF